MALQAEDTQLEDEELETTEQTVAEVEVTPSAAQDVAEVTEASDDVVETGAGPVFSAQTLELAARTGLDPDDYRDEAAFYRAVARQDRALAEHQRQFGGQRQQPTQSPVAPTQATTSQQVQALKRLELEKYFKSTPDGEIDPQIVAAYKDLHDATFGHLDTLSQQVAKYEVLNKKFEELEARHQFEEQRRFVAEWDSFFAEAGKGYEEKLGKGSQNEISQLNLMTRDAVVGTALALRQMDEDRGLKPLSNKQYGQRALLSVLGTETNAIARKEILAKAKARTGAALANSPIKKGPEKSKEDKAYQVFKEKAKKIGLISRGDED